MKTKMNTELFIAKRFIKSQRGNRKYTMPIIRLSVVAIALSLAVMIISVAVVTGFKQEIRNRVIGFGGHIQIVNYDANNSWESSAISKEQEFLPALKKLPGIKSIQVFATKPALIKTKQENLGVIIKGIGSDFDTNFFSQNLKEGKIINVFNKEKTNEVLVSEKIAKTLRLKVNSKFIAFFLDERTPDRPINKRVFTVSGIYETSLEQFDEQIILADIRHIQKLSDWEDDQIGGFEILINNYGALDYMTEIVRGKVEYRYTEDGNQLRVKNITESYPQIFDWLALLNMNVRVILIIMVFVAAINMISGLIILILDRTPSIGLLKAIGTNNASMRKIFLYQSLFLIIKGILWGNIFALTLMFLQEKYHLIRLNQSSYFIDYAPVNFNIFHIFMINLGALITIFLFMILPVLIVSRIQPVKTLRYS